jgi:hypothetical protein
MIYLFAGIGLIRGFVDAIAKRSTERRASVFDRRRRDDTEPRSRTTETRSAMSATDAGCLWRLVRQDT